MSEALHLLGDGLDDQGGARSDVQHGDPGTEVDERVAVDVDHDATGRTLGEDRHRRADAGRHRRLPAGSELQRPGPRDGSPDLARLRDLDGFHHDHHLQLGRARHLTRASLALTRCAMELSSADDVSPSRRAKERPVAASRPPRRLAGRPRREVMTVVTWRPSICSGGADPERLPLLAHRGRFQIGRTRPRSGSTEQDHLLPGDRPGVLQGVSELFPVSSLGHAVIFPALFGWHNLVASESKPESFWLAFVVALHVGTAFALLAYFWKDWKAIIVGVVRSAAPGDLDADRAPRLAPRGRDHPRRHHRPHPRAPVPGVVLQTACSLDLPRDQRVHPLRRRSLETPAEIRERRKHLAPRRVLDFKEAGVIGRPRYWHCSRASAGRA